MRTLGDVQGTTVVVGAVSLAVVFGLRIVAAKVPGALVPVVGGLLASWLLGLGSEVWHSLGRSHGDFRRSSCPTCT